ncbi:hemolysin family protein [Lachnospiraceae bacterium NSJ-143]|nr:hemolysin family protein [Lachnospiraceae bacterium NSJ-143]
MDGDNLGQIIFLVILIMFSAFFSATETAFSSINKIRMKNMANNGDKKAASVLELIENYDKFLSTILIGNNIVNISASSLAAVLFISHFPKHGASISTAVMTIVVLIFGEITPKSIAKDFPEKFAMFSVPFVKVLCFILSPINFIFSSWKRLLSKVFVSDESRGLTEEELLTMVEEAQDDGGINDEEGELIRNAIEFNDIQVTDVHTPRVDVVAIDETDSREEIDRVFCESNFTRLPVYRDTIDNIIGIINQKDFYNSNKFKGDIKDIISKPLYVIPNMKISELLPLLQANKTHIAVITDEYGGTVGIVTLEDILEELVGEIWDEHDEVVEDFIKISDTEYKVMGSADLDDLFDLFDMKNEFESSTVGGWITEEMNRFPKAGDSFTYKQLTVTVTKANSRRIYEAYVTVDTDYKEEDDD